MEFEGKIKGITTNYVTNEIEITFSTTQNILPEFEKLKNVEKLRVKAVQHREKRSLNANAYLWVLLGKIAEVLRADKWDIYLMMLKRYGKYTYIVVKPNVVDAVKKQWREVEELGEISINGQTGIQLLCYFGSSTYDTHEMAVLIDGVVSEAKELDIETLSPDEIKRLKDQWGVDIEKV